MNLPSANTLSFPKDGTAIDCARFGSGARPLVLLPGLSFQRVRSAALTLAYMYRAFTKSHTVYVIDKKDTVPDGYTIRDIADDTAYVMERLGITNADVFGVSQGGMIAQYLAIYYPGMVHKLALGVTASRPNRVMEEAVCGWIRMAEAGDYAAIVRDMLPKMYSAGYVKQYGWLLPLISRVGRPKPEGFTRFINLAKACLTCNSYPELHRITCPTLVLGGREDKVLTAEASEETAGALGCKIYMYEGLGHAAYEEASDFNKRISLFLSDDTEGD